MQTEVLYRPDNQSLEGELKFEYLNHNTSLNGLTLASKGNPHPENVMALQIQRRVLTN